MAGILLLVVAGGAALVIAYVVSGPPSLASTDHARQVFAATRFGRPYDIVEQRDDPADPGAVGYKLQFDHAVDTSQLRPPLGFEETCGDACFEGPEPGGGDGRCELSFQGMAQRGRATVLVTCGPAYGDP